MMMKNLKWDDFLVSFLISGVWSFGKFWDLQCYQNPKMMLEIIHSTV
jgi:hypothetical protein